jgi:O-antigen/teichoic acid export membrane protein
MAGNGTQFTVVFLLLVYLARVLEPRDFGLMATVSVGLDLGTRIARWGQVELLQQPRFAGDAFRNQSLRLSLGLGLLFALIFALSARPLGRLYGSEELATMLLLSAPVFLFTATGSSAEAVLRSEFRFKTLAFRSSVATLLGAAAAIIFVNLGFGALTLAIQRLVQAACSGLWVWSAIDWRPSWRLRQPWSAELAREGAGVMAGTLLPVAVPRSIDLLVGLFMGPAVLGLLRVAFRINEFVGQMVVMPLVSVANAELSAQVHDPDRMRQSYLRLVQASAILMCPGLIGLTLVAPEAVLFLFGPKWSAAVPIVEVIGLLALVAPINYYFAPAMVALGQSRLVVRQGFWQIGLGIGLTLIAAQVSLVAIALAHVVRGVVVSALNVRDLRRQMGLGLGALGRSLAVPYLATLVMTLAMLAGRFGLVGALASPLRLFVLVAIGAASYAVTLRLLAWLGLWPDYQLLAEKILPARWRRRPGRPESARP